MKIEELLDDMLIQSALAGAIHHPSQVVSTIRHLIGTPGPSMMMRHRVGKQRLLERLSTVTDIDKPLLDPALVVSGKSAFVLKPRELTSIEIVGCSDFVLDLSDIQKNFRASQRPKFVIVLSGCKNFAVRGGCFSGARNVCLVADCEAFSIEELTTVETEGYGIIAFNSKFFEVKDCLHINGLASGLYCLGNTFNGWIHDNVYYGGQGYYNWDAGLHINHCTPQLTLEDIPERSHEDRRIVEKTLKPSLLYIENNHISSNRAQGIYCEGAIQCCFESNTIVKNNKEGICFDWGSALNLFCGNSVTGNGERAAMSDAEIKADFIEQYPKLSDGSSSCKLPGISIDNGAFNLVAKNTIELNFGGGIKAVRTGIGNLILGNAILDNAAGRNMCFRSYSGILYLGMGAGEKEFNQSDAKLDFLPSEYNICFGNFFRVDRRDQCVENGRNSKNNHESGNVIS